MTTNWKDKAKYW